MIPSTDQTLNQTVDIYYFRDLTLYFPTTSSDFNIPRSKQAARIQHKYTTKPKQVAMGISTLLCCTFYSTKKSRTAFATNNKSANLKPHGLALRAAPWGDVPCSSTGKSPWHSDKGIKNKTSADNCGRGHIYTETYPLLTEFTSPRL